MGGGSGFTGDTRREPIAVVGVSCRLPQAPDPSAFWRLLVDATDAITDVPPGRWVGEVAPGCRRGGFLDDVEGFDAAFFGVSPHEAAAMDPQQRLALELTWEALEEAHLLPADLQESATGVFLAAISQEYAVLADRLGADAAGAHTYTGTHRSLIANRVSYTLGLRGPSLTVDCGQSSSLVAVHLACESLRRGETALAVAGGVDLHLLADTTSLIGRFGALSPDGRCHVFDHRANGYVRGEGGALVVLKPLTAAERDGDRIHALILGSAVNNEGGGASLTAPTARAQQEVLTLACADAGVTAAEIQYVELHGTGTPVGDPVEAAGLGAALTRGRPASAPLLVGSVKTNVGHLEGAAGITGLLKVVMALEHERLPATLHFEQANPAIALDDLGLRVVDTAQPFPGPAVAGVSSFGMGGTNCHVVLASAPARKPAEKRAAAELPWLLSARTADGLRAQAERLQEVARTADPDALALALRHGRTAFDHRGVLLGPDPAAGLAALAAGRPDASVVTGSGRHGPVVLTFPGQGSQWPEMARALAADSPVFAARLAECADALEPFVDYSLLDVLAGEGGPELDRVDVVQPALWAVMVSLAALWRTNGVTPDVVIGHSQGEIAAATVAGALSLADGARVVALRSRALRAIAGSGGMLSLGAPLAVVETAVAARTPHVTLAAVNGPSSAVVSGPTEQLAALECEFEAAGHRARMIPVDYASHSAAVEPIRDELLRQLAPLRPRSCGTLFVSALTGAPMDTAGLDAEYWYRSLRHPVRFASAVQHALDLRAAVVIECSAHPVSVTAVEQAAEVAEVPLTVIGTLRRGDGGLDRFRFALAQAHVGGAPVDWAGGRRPARHELVTLPTYAFQRRRHWLDGDGIRTASPAAPTTATEGPTQPGSAPATRRELRELVRSLTAQVLGYAAATDIEPTHTFKDLGADSTTAVDLRNRLRSATGLSLPTGLLFDHPTPDRVAQHLHRLATGGTQPGLVAAPEASTEPIAVVAMGCRLPGGITSPEELWRLVSAGEDAISAFPGDRGWDLTRLAADGPDRSGTSDTRFGGFLTDADLFDADFFGISPREALAMDPQQRLLLEVCWETVERAGIDPATLSGTDTGVFIGAMSTDYGPRLHQPDGAVDGHLLTGTALSVTSGRIAYQLGLLGPALTIDTACSSSLVALQLAVRALRGGECAMALTGGATVMATPGMFVEFSRQGGLAVDGRCKAFAAAADGTAWAEGVGVLLLMRSSDARRLGHPVLAEIRGVAVNQDGRSNGLTAPNGPAQERVIRQALADAGLRPAEVDVVEAHGTGTRLGDPLEAEALRATYGREHSAEAPMWLGSLKSNIGHTQAAAGVAGLIKMVLALQYRRLPRTLHAAEPTSHVDWSDGALRLLSEPVSLPADRPVRAAVSSFGISGTNAHVVLESAALESAALESVAAESIPGPVSDGPLVWVLSARTDTALRAMAVALCDYATTAPVEDLAAAGRALAARTAFAHRAAVVAADREQLLAGLAALAQDSPHSAVVTGTAADDVRPVFVFPGQGTQWAGMAVGLAADFPVFGEHLRRCDEALAPLTGWSVLDVLRTENDAPPLAGSEVIQPVLFAVMVSLAALWRSFGVQPEAVLGHSQGEIAAACSAGALSIDEAARIVLLRSRALTKLTGTGGMLALAVPTDRATELIAPYAEQLWVAIVNGPENTVVAGDVDALDTLAEHCSEHGVRARRVAIDYAAHTPHVEAVQADLLADLAGTTPTSTDIAVCSSATGGFVDPAELTAAFWYFGLRHPVRFDESVRSCVGDGTPLFIEVSPHPALIGHVQDTLLAAGLAGQAIGSLRRDDGGAARFLGALGQAFVAGAAVDWAAVLGSPSVPPAGLPTYQFEHRRYWIEPPTRTVDPGLTGAAACHPAITAVVQVGGDDGVLVSATVSARTQPWLDQHVIGHSVLLPGTAFVELALVAGEAAGCDLLEDLTLELPLLLPDSGEVDVPLQLLVGAPREDGRRSVAVHSRRPDGPGWIRHATGTLGIDRAPTGPSAPWPPPGTSEIDVTGLYDDLLARGYDYGPAFQGVLAARRDDEGRWVEVALPEPAAADAERYLLHPALLDAALHLLVADAGDLLLPFAWRGVRVSAAGAGSLRVRLVRTGGDRAALTGYDGAGNPVVHIDELVLRAVPRQLDRPSEDLTPYRVEWVELPGSDAAADPLVWSVVDADGQGAGLTAALERAGARVTVCYDLPSVADLTSGDVPDVVLVPVLPDADLSDVGYQVRETVYAALDLVQGWLGDSRFAASRLVFLTAGAVTAAAPGGLVSAPLWGLVRSARAEHPGRFGLLDIDGSDAPWAGVAAALAAGESELRASGGRLHVPRLRPDPGNGEPGSESPSGLGDGTVLVTGGTSGLGALVAQRLAAAHGVRHLLLASRRGPAAPDTDALLARLAELGARAQAVSCDVSDRRQVAALLAGIPAERALCAVVHAAGVVDDATVEGLTAQNVDAVLAPKLDAGWLLHEATRELPLARFVTFSSVAGVFGNAGQANYAAANAFLDGLAAHRRTAGLPATSVAWGLWDVETAVSGGLGPAGVARLARTGIAALASEDGLRLFDAAWHSTEPLVVAARWDGAGLRTSAEAGTLAPALRDLVPAPRRTPNRTNGAVVPVTAMVTSPAGSTAGLAERLSGLAAADGRRMLGDLIRSHVAAVLAQPSPDAIDVDRAFHEMGFDSLTAVELRNRLDRETGLVLSATVAFDYPNVAALAEHLHATLAPAGPTPAETLRTSLADLRAAVAPGDDDTRRAVAALLRRALAGFEDHDDAALDLDELASDEQLFALIDQQS